MMLLKQEGVPTLVESHNGDDPGWKSLGISYFDNVTFHKATTTTLPALITGTRNSMKNPNKPALCHSPTV